MLFLDDLEETATEREDPRLLVLGVLTPESDLPLSEVHVAPFQRPHLTLPPVSSFTIN
jgi:hypothetical protein